MGLGALSLMLGLASCQSTTIGDKPDEPDKPDKPEGNTPGGWKPPTDPGPTPPAPDPDPDPDPKPPEPDPDPNPPEELQFGVPVPGQAGMIRSPHAPTSGLIDVTGMKPGTKIRCPYSGKIIKVP